MDADNLALDRGWLGQVEDRADATTGTGTGLTYLNARYYDPVLARFISPDPFRDLGNPQSFDGYAYSFNNPVVFVDASGLFPSICIPMPPNGSNCRTPGQMVSSGYDPQSVLTAGAVDGSVTAVVETGYSLTPEGVSENWRSFNASVDDQGLGMTLMSGGASAMGVDGMASMSQCASSLMCMGTSQGQYGFGQDAGSFGARYTMFASTAIVGSGSTTMASSQNARRTFGEFLADSRRFGVDSKLSGNRSIGNTTLPAGVLNNKNAPVVIPLINRPISIGWSVKPAPGKGVGLVEVLRIKSPIVFWNKLNKIDVALGYKIKGSLRTRR